MPLFLAKTTTDWTTYSPTLVGYGTPTNTSFAWRRVGSNLEVRGNFTSGTPTAVEARIPFPSGLTSDSTLPTISVAGGGVNDFGTANIPVILREPSVTYFTVGIQGSSFAGLTKQNANIMVTAGQGISFIASCPISGWSA